jgi:hypothetical protein
MSVNFNSSPSVYTMYKGIRAAEQNKCCTFKGTEGKIMATTTVAGTIIGGMAGGGIGLIPGAAGGYLVGFAVVAVKKSIEEGRCVIL